MNNRAVFSIANGLQRPLWRGRIHTWAFWATIPAVVVLLTIVDQPIARIGAIVFGASKLTLYGVSASYHRLARSDNAQRIMRRLDHSMIFVLIAGTYTPVCLVVVPDPWRFPMLSGIWIVAAIGIGLKTAGHAGFMKWSNVLYIALGWLGVVALPVMIPNLSTIALVFMFAGGLLYTVGALLFYRQSPDPNPLVFGYHEVWHGFTVLAGISHFAMVTAILK